MCFWACFHLCICSGANGHSPLWFEQEENLMADHLDAPGLVSPDSNPKTDITDIYLFQKPGNASKSILILNVNPLAPTLANEFESNGLYELKIDTDGDALAEIAFHISFTPVTNGQQWATVRRVTGAQAEQDANSGEVIIAQAPVSFGSTALVTKSGPYKFFAGLRSDETSAVFFNNHFSHAVLRVPKPGEFRANYDLGVTENAVTLSTEQKATVERLYAQCEQDVLYARLDFVETATGIQLMELELIEPYLFFDFKDGAADDFVNAFAQRVERK